MSVRLRALVGYVLAAVTVAPLVWLLVTVLKPADELFEVALPSRFTLDNLLYVLTEVPIGRYMLNSLVVSVAVTVVALVLHSMAAYALARLRFPGRQVIFSMIVSTLLVSLPVILVPLFLVARQLGLLDTYAGLILPAIFHAFGIFLLRQYYLTIPRELEEAADLDGCGYFRRWWQVVVPLSRPVLASLAVLFFLANWNAFLWPLTATRDPELRMVQVGIATLQGQYGSAWNYVLAATVIAAVPTLIAFVLGQRRLVEAIKTSGLK
ncbi:carbohydrate ABC transporter permease [Nonomuraea angiospora]|uniref:Multiple sugar transport system permease protein n=1 Tax=Nonomuraea angiospora TaxID=46172 RepID=A0ABR9LP57_9ACTN|nr:carbohydrate ABC transporter permease [Nonomuraea angiospora]MBE1582442.1 multiple sugar transport system permease protein [Nonomuraea angiospora]MDX3106052.1 carbohydrate ABC transporter permease [Nonomuraea angiospora]